MSEYKKPLPQPDPVTAPYWESLQQHAMKIQRCNDTGKYFFYPRGLSPFTFSDNISWEPVSGAGTLHAFTIVYNMRAPGFADEVPYVVAIVELDEGPRMETNIVDCALDQLHVGMRVGVTFEDEGELVLPRFRPA